MVDRGGGVAHRKQRRRGGGSPVGHEVGNNIAMVCSLRELEWGKKRKGEDKVRSAKRRVSDTPTRKETREGGSGTGTRAKNREPTSVPGKEGVQSKDEASAAPCHGHVSMTQVGLTTDSFCRTHSDSDPTSVARSPGTGAMSNRVFQIL
jgi:hypothetical protein